MTAIRRVGTSLVYAIAVEVVIAGAAGAMAPTDSLRAFVFFALYSIPLVMVGWMLMLPLVLLVRSRRDSGLRWLICAGVLVGPVLEVLLESAQCTSTVPTEPNCFRLAQALYRDITVQNFFFDMAAAISISTTVLYVTTLPQTNIRQESSDN